MRFGGKSFDFFWPAIRWPSIILGSWFISGFVVISFSVEAYRDVYMHPFVGNVLPLVFYFIAGYLLFADHGGATKEASWAGALTGFLTGVVSVIVSILLMKMTPYMDIVVEMAVSQSASAGQVVDADLVRRMMGLMMSIGLVFSPFISGLIGALFGWLGGLAARRIEDK